jgi:Domain of unknown function (DUF4426)
MKVDLRALSAAALVFLSACDQPAAPGVSTREPPLRATESFRDFGDYVVHFNAITTSQLIPEIARQYGIVRSNNRGMLNVSIIRKAPDSIGTPVPGSVFASAVNLTGQIRELDMREIHEEDAVYYIAEFGVANEETLIFTIDVTPMNEPSRFSVRYMKQFFTN